MNKILVKNKPKLQESNSIVRNAISRNLFVIIVSRCKVDYIGRSTSKLGWGERVIIIKPDKSVLIHRKTGYEPINWQPPGGSISILNDESLFKIRIQRRKPLETLLVTSNQILLLSAFSPVDEAFFENLFTEEELCKVLIKNPDMIEERFRITSEQKKIGNGRADITGIDKNGIYTIIEVKKVTIDKTAINQLDRYVSNIRKNSSNIRAIIIGPSINHSARKIAKDLSLEYKKIDLKICSEKWIRELEYNEKLDKHM